MIHKIVIILLLLLLAGCDSQKNPTQREKAAMIYIFENARSYAKDGGSSNWGFCIVSDTLVKYKSDCDHYETCIYSFNYEYIDKKVTNVKLAGYENVTDALSGCSKGFKLDYSFPADTHVYKFKYILKTNDF